MSTLRATNIKNPDSGSNNIVLSEGGGVVISGVTTSSSFVGNVTGNATGLSGTPNLNVGVVTATSFVGDGSGLTGVGGASGNRNLIINGAMNVAQRGTQETGVTSQGYLVVDRYRFNPSNLGTWTLDQDTNAPSGFSNSFKITCTTADASPAAGDLLVLFHFIEAQNLQHLKYGDSGAENVTLSFWVKSNKTGSASFTIRQPDNSSKLYSTTYNISSADTWEYKTITISGDTGGVINNDNGNGLQCEWWLNSGTDYSSGTASNAWVTNDNTRRNPSNLGVGGAISDYFAITGVQLEVGSSATTFEHRSYGDELQRCKRYFQATEMSNFGLPGYAISSTQARFCASFFPEMRDDPTLTTDTLANFAVQYTNSSATTTAMVFSGVSQNNARIIATVASGLTAGQGVSLLGQNVSFPKLYYSAEL